MAAANHITAASSGIGFCHRHSMDNVRWIWLEHQTASGTSTKITKEENH
jgi:hypothetical protein